MTHHNNFQASLTLEQKQAMTKLLAWLKRPVRSRRSFVLGGPSGVGKTFLAHALPNLWDGAITYLHPIEADPAAPVGERCDAWALWQHLAMQLEFNDGETRLLRGFTPAPDLIVVDDGHFLQEQDLLDLPCLGPPLLILLDRDRLEPEFAGLRMLKESHALKDPHPSTLVRLEDGSSRMSRRVDGRAKSSRKAATELRGGLHPRDMTMTPAVPASVISPRGERGRSFPV